MARAFLIGAGATKAQYNEAPLSSNFFEILSDKNKQLFDEIASTMKQYIDKKLSLCNVEDLVILAYEVPLSHRTSFLSCIYKAIYQLLAKSTKSNEEYMDEYINKSTVEPPTLFYTLLNDTRLTEEDFFMTLNYDLYLDREIFAIRREIDYGLNSEYIESKKDIQVVANNKFSLYHLHGALNWEMIGDKVKIYLGAKLPRYIRATSDLCIVPPGKKEFFPVLQSIWSRAKARLLKADELIVIGTSLNPKDTELIELIKGYIDKNGIENVKIICKCDPEEIVDYNNTIGMKVMNVYPHGFFLNDPSGKYIGTIEYIFN